MRFVIYHLPRPHTPLLRFRLFPTLPSPSFDTLAALRYHARMSEVWTITELNRYVRQALALDYRLQEVRVAGEISGFKAYPSGHWYFTLKDANAQVSCVLWRARAQQQTFMPRDGDAVEAVGQATLYETRGQFQLDVAYLQQRGAGDLYRRFVELKERLEAEGLFAPQRKRPLPIWPRRIGLVTSPKGAVLRDMATIIRRRYPVVELVLAPTAVQGAEAPPQIVAALQSLQAVAPDVIIVGRGGGSLEDLWCFNDERVVRAIAACPTPVVSAVGHETDFTLADFAADMRAPTPSAAAELVTPDGVVLRHQLAALGGQLADALSVQVRDKRLALQLLQTQLNAQSPTAQLANARQRVDDLHARAFTALNHRLLLDRERTTRLAQLLHSLSPLQVLQRGYAIVTKADGEVILRTDQAPPGTPLQVRVSDGTVEVEVRKEV